MKNEVLIYYSSMLMLLIFVIMLLSMPTICAQTTTYPWPTNTNSSTNKNRINGNYGEYRATNRFHGGIDFSKLYGTDVFAMTGGTLRGPFGTGINRYMDIIDPNGNFTTRYMHISNQNCPTCVSTNAQGVTVTAGQKIGVMVSQTQVHLHLEHRDGNNLLEHLQDFEDLPSDPTCTNHVLAFSSTYLTTDDGVQFRYDGLRKNTSSTRIHNTLVNQKRLLFGKTDIEAHVSDPRISATGLPDCASNRVAPNSLYYSIFDESGSQVMEPQAGGSVGEHGYEFYQIPNDAPALYVFAPQSAHPGAPSIHILTSHPYDMPYERYWNTALRTGINQTWPAKSSSDYDNQNARNISEALYNGTLRFKQLFCQSY